LEQSGKCSNHVKVAGRTFSEVAENANFGETVCANHLEIGLSRTINANDLISANDLIIDYMHR